MHEIRRKTDRIAERRRPSGPLRCPVCARKFEPDEEAEGVDFGGQVLWLCSIRCVDEFDRQPLRYSD